MLGSTITNGPIGIDPDGRAVWYAATSLLGAVAESFGNLGFVDRGAGRRVVVARVASPLVLIDLVGVAARAFGLDQRIGTTTAYEQTQAWSRAWYEAYPSAVGVRWRGRQSGSTCILLTDRAEMAALRVESDHRLDEAAVWPRIARAARRCHLEVL